MEVELPAIGGKGKFGIQICRVVRSRGLVSAGRRDREVAGGAVPVLERATGRGTLLDVIEDLAVA